MSPRVAYQKQRRDAARARGDCIQCCKRKAVTKSRCDQCALANAKAYAEKTGTVVHEGKQCSSCRGTGHDARTCPQRATPFVRAAPAEKQWCDECIACGFHRAGCPVAESEP